MAHFFRIVFGRKWLTFRVSLPARTNRKKLKSGEERIYGVYYCTQMHKEHIHPDCSRTLNSRTADEEIWEKVTAALENPELFLEGARLYIAGLQDKAAETGAERERLQGQLDALTMERQQIIMFARKGKITEEDMEYQLGEMDMQAAYLRRALAGIRDVTELAALDNWEDRARAYLEELRLGVEELNDASLDTEEERRRQFEIKRELVQILVNKVHVDKGKKIRAELRLDVLALVNTPCDGCEVQSAGTCSRRQSCPLRPRCAACG
jgi:hypothetical protein